MRTRLEIQPAACKFTQGMDLFPFTPKTHLNRKRFSYVDYDTVYTNEIALLCRKQGEVSFGIADQLNIVIVGRLAIHDSRALRDV